jgi:Sideroflexins
MRNEDAPGQPIDQKRLKVRAKLFWSCSSCTTLVTSSRPTPTVPLDELMNTNQSENSTLNSIQFNTDPGFERQFEKKGANMSSSIAASVRAMLMSRPRQSLLTIWDATTRRSKSTATTSSGSSSSTNNVVIPSLAAALAGVLTVSGVAALVENATSSSCPAFVKGGERFDQSTYGGRFAKQLLACDPRLLWYSTSEIRKYQELLQKHEALQQQQPSSKRTDDNRFLYEATRIVRAAVHPDTNEIVPPPFRMSGYVPFNG